MAHHNQSIRDLVKSEDAHGSVLLAWAADRLGLESLQWHPAVLRTEFEAVAEATLPENNFDKLMAALAITTTDLFFRSEGGFSTLAVALCGGGFHPGQFVPPDSAECAWAVTEGLLLSPPDDEDPEPFSDPVRQLIGKVLHEEGFLAAPDVLRIAIGLPGPVDHGPEINAAVAEEQQRKTAEVTTIIRDGLNDLLAQIQSLDFRDNSIKRDFAARLNAAITQEGNHR